MSTILTGYPRIILSSVAVYAFIVIAIRIFGKKELSQLSVVDLVFILLISNSVQNAMVGSNSTLIGGLVSAGSLFIINYLFKLTMFRFPRLGRAIQGDAILLVYEGNINHKNMNKAKITSRELMEVIREHGISTIGEVNLAVLEVDGNISILSDEFKHKTIKKRKAHKIINKSQ